MGEMSFDYIVADFVIRGCSLNVAINLASLIFPDYKPKKYGVEYFEIIDCLIDLPEKWKDENIASECENCAKKNEYMQWVYENCVECFECDFEKDCDDCEHRNVSQNNPDPCQYCSNFNFTSPSSLEKLSEIYESKNCDFAEIHVDGSNLLYTSSSNIQLKNKLINKNRSIYVEFSSNHSKLYTNTYLMGSFLCIDEGEMIYGDPKIYMASNQIIGSRAIWLNLLNSKLNFKHINVEKKHLKLGKKFVNYKEDEIMKKSIISSLYKNNISHYIICTGDGNSNCTGFTFPEVIEQILKADRKVTIYGFKNSISDKYYKLKEKYESMNIKLADNFSFFLQTNLNKNKGF